jgi:hypothetical protein
MIFKKMWIQGVVYIAILMHVYKLYFWFGVFVLDYSCWTQLYWKVMSAHHRSLKLLIQKVYLFQVVK